jgi:hypothetical protein
MARPGVSGLPTEFITGSAVFTKEQAELIRECANRSNGNKNHSLRTAIQRLCLDAIDIHTILDIEEIEKIVELGDGETLCGSLAILAKKSLWSNQP